MKWKNNIIQFLNNCFNLSSNKRNPELQNIYNKIDKIDKSDDFMMINSDEGLTEEEFLQVLKNEFFNCEVQNDARAE